MNIVASDTLRSHASGSFVLLPSMGSLEGHRFGVVTSGPEVLAVLDADHPAGSAFLIAPEDLTFATFSDSLAVTLLDLEPIAVVLLNRDRVTGVLPVSALVEYLGSGAHEPPPTEMGPHGSTDDGTTHGPARLPLARVTCHEPGCGYVNELAYFDRARPPRCVHPTLPEHRLRTGGSHGR